MINEMSLISNLADTIYNKFQVDVNSVWIMCCFYIVAVVCVLIIVSLFLLNDSRK